MRALAAMNLIATYTAVLVLLALAFCTFFDGRTGPALLYAAGAIGAFVLSLRRERALDHLDIREG